MKLPQEGYDDSRARRLYGKDYDDNDGYFYGPGDYQPIIDSFGIVLVQVDDGDYQGDSRVLLGKDGRFGFLNFGWGSCSGCDGLQACSSFRDIEELIRGLQEVRQGLEGLAMSDIQGAPITDYSPEDQAFYRFWYGHMLNDLMQPPLANIDHATARYIWDAARGVTVADGQTFSGDAP